MPRTSSTLLGIVLALLLAHAPARAAGENAHVASTANQARGLLWKIERGGGRPSYLYGTIHLADPRVTNLPGPVRETLNTAERFVMEIVPDAAGLSHFTQAMFFRDERTLKSAVGAALYADVEKAFSRRGLPLIDLERYKPWAVSLILALPAPQGALPLDLLLYSRAREQGISVHGLETVQEQVAVFDDLSLANQRALLEATLREQQAAAAQLERLVQAYLARDLARLRALSAQHAPEDRAVHATVMRRLLTERNRRMVERADRWLREGGAFVAVGAAHLPGPEGMLELLQRGGYRVRPVY